MNPAPAESEAVPCRDRLSPDRPVIAPGLLHKFPPYLCGGWIYRQEYAEPGAPPACIPPYRVVRELGDGGGELRTFRERAQGEPADD